MSDGNSGGWPTRAWRGWCGFWFTPADPTPLAFMRIVAGLLTLYVHIAYCLDLNSFFGQNGWYSRDLAERAYREYPIMLPLDDWAPRFDRFNMPSNVEVRRALREFIDNVNNKPNGRQALQFLAEWPANEGDRLEMVRYISKLSTDDLEREGELAKMVVADPDDDQNKLALPSWLLRQDMASRQARRADIHLLCQLLPKDVVQRGWMMNMLQLWRPRTTEGSSTAEFLLRFIDEMNETYPPDQRAAAWDYAVFWGLPKHWAYATGHWYYSPFYYVSDVRILWLIHSLHLLVIFLFTIGFQTRITSVLTWLAALAYYQRNPIILFGQDTMMNLSLLYLMMSPCGAVWSVDALIARYRRAKKSLAEGRIPTDPPVKPMISAGFVIRLLQVHYCFMYMSAGLAKLKGDSWWAGTAPWATMNNPEFSPVHITWYRDFVGFLCEHRLLWELYMNAGVIFTLVVEIGFPFCVWTRLRPVFVAGSILLHLGIALNMGLHVFSLFMFTLLLCWMPPESIRRVFARPPANLKKLRVRFSGRSEEQRKAASLVHALDVWGQTELEDRRNADSQPVEVAVDDAATAGPSGLRAALRALPMTQPVAWLVGPLFAFVAGGWFGGGKPVEKAEAKKTVGV